MPQKDGPGWLQALTLVTQLGLSFVISVFLSFWIGDWLDRQFQTSFLKIVFLFLGLIAGGWSWYRLLKPFLSQ
jgi:uncharacterized membrane protein YfcA